jgi:uncharacterized membrane protein YiaA
MDLLTALGAALAAAHFGAPLAYYAAARRWLKMPWRIKPDPAYLPAVTVAIPTYNEARHIEEKLEDVYRQDYPRDRLETIVIALITLGITLMALALINAQIGYSPGIHTSITGGMATIIGYNLLLLGVMAELTLAKRLGLQPHSITQKLKKLTSGKAVAIGVALVVVGIIYLTLSLYLRGSSYRRLPLRGENMIALTSIALGFELISSSFVLKSIS